MRGLFDISVLNVIPFGFVATVRGNFNAISIITQMPPIRRIELNTLVEFEKFTKYANVNIKSKGLKGRIRL